MTTWPYTSTNGRTWTKDEWYQNYSERLDSFRLNDFDDPDIGPLFPESVAVAHQVLQQMYLCELNPVIFPSIDGGILFQGRYADRQSWFVEVDQDDEEHGISVMVLRTGLKRQSAWFEQNEDGIAESVYWLAMTIKEFDND